MKKNATIYIAGHRGMVGSALYRKLKREGFTNFIFRTSRELDLRNQAAVNEFFAVEKPNYVFLAAAKVGGILANNTYRGEFIYDNLMIQNNVIHAAYVHGVTKLMFLGSSCIYPKLAPQPLREDYLLTGLLEPTNEPYAIAKIAGIKLCDAYRAQYGSNFISVMPTNLYGVHDNFHPENSHVIPALIRRFHEAKLNGDNEVIAWGSGKPMREFLYVDDMADASIHVMNLDKITYDENTEPMLSHINIGTGTDCTIRELVETVAKVVGFDGNIKFDKTKPDGAPRKLMDVSRLKLLGWEYSVSLEDGLVTAYQWFIDNQETFRA